MVQKSTPRILIVSENSELISEIGDFLAEAQYNSVRWSSSSPFKDILPLQAIIFDLPEEEDEVLYFIQTLKTHAPLVPIIALVDEGCVKKAVRIMQEGARTALTKPVDKHSLLLALNDIHAQPANSVQAQSIIQQAIHLLQSLNTGDLDAGVNPSQLASDPRVSTPQEVLKLENLIIDLTRQKVFYRETPIDLTTSQFRLLSCLAKSHRRIVPYEDLYFYLHNIQLDSAAARTALSAHLSYLRAKLSEVGCEEYLVNIRGRGYVLDIPTEVKPQANGVGSHQVLQQLPVLVWTTDAELPGDINSWHASFQPVNKLPNLIGSSVSDFLQLNEPDHPLLIAHHQALTGQRYQYEQWLGNHLFSLCVVPYLDRHNDIIGAIGLALHIPASAR